nr:tRNA (guanine(26)-N(2))-dimethyltransferase [Tanacetum cinerariifolium]
MEAMDESFHDLWFFSKMMCPCMQDDELLPAIASASMSLSQKEIMVFCRLIMVYNGKCEETPQHELCGTSEEPKKVPEGKGQGKTKPSKAHITDSLHVKA